MKIILTFFFIIQNGNNKLQLECFLINQEWANEQAFRLQYLNLYPSFLFVEM